MLKKTILIVEDDLGISELLANLLEEEGYFTLQAYNSRQALQLLRDVNCDLITLDFGLPDMNGNELLDKLLQHFKTVPPVIMVTATPHLVKPNLLIKTVIAKPYNGVENSDSQRG